MKKALLLSVVFSLTSLLLSAQQLSGTVRDSDQKPLGGAHILVVGTNTVTVSDHDGHFTLPSPIKFPAILRISLVGFKSLERQIPAPVEDRLVFDLDTDDLLAEIVVTARRRAETAQDVPVPISVVGGAYIEESGAFNVNRIKELVPTVQLYSSNPRNTTLNIRGLGSTFGLTNDGIDPGVGFYVDGVYFARPAATTLDFIDVEQIEVLRGPQGTLFGKNTTAGAFNITTRKPSFKPGASFELSYGNYGYVQAKSSITGPLSSKLAGRVSFSGTQRDGNIYNVTSQKYINDINNLGIRAQLLYKPNDNLNITFAGDASRQRPEGFAQVVAGVAPTLRAPYRQFENIIKDLNYDLPSRNPFDRVIDHNTTWRSGNDLGGVSVNIDAGIGAGTLTSTTAWRYWNWDPSNDRDFTGLAQLALSQAPSRHQQWSQEVRYAGNITRKLSGVIGVFAIGQRLRADPYHTEESGEHQWRFAQNSNSPLWQTPGLFDGYGIRTKPNLDSFSGAAFLNLDYAITSKLSILPGIRFNYDYKKVDFSRETYGGLHTNDPELIALKNVVYNDQAFTADARNNNFSGQLTLAYKASSNVKAYATYSTNYKPVGVNLGGLPRSGGLPMTELAQIKPEYVTHFEAGIKTQPTATSTVNLTLYNTNIRDFQTQVQAADPGVNRGYLANAEKVGVFGIELDAQLKPVKFLTFNGAFAYTDGKYISFTNAPVPLEETGAPEAFKDVSGTDLPGISKWSGSLGGEATAPGKFLGLIGKFFIGFDSFYRSSFSSSSSVSRYMNVDGYALLNARAGFRVSNGVSVSLWGRNILDQNYFEQLLPAGGGAGHYAAVLGDPRTYGVTLRYSY